MKIKNGKIPAEKIGRAYAVPMEFVRNNFFHDTGVLTDEKKKNIVPPADIILNMLNEKPGADLDLLDFYKGYIRRASIEPSYSEEGFDKWKHINEDLRQEIEIAELLLEFDRLVDHALCLVVVANLDETGQREILA